MTTIDIEPAACPVPATDDLAGRVASLPPGLRTALEEVLASAEELGERAGTRPVELRHLLHTVFERSVNEFFTATPTSMQLPAELMGRITPAPGAIALPPARQDLDLTLIDALDARRSERSFGKEPVSLEDLATFLYWSVGVRGYEAGYGVAQVPLFRFPSIGGLSGVDFEVLAHRVEDLPRGRYRYDAVGHGLVPVDLGDFRAGIDAVTYESSWLFYAPFVVACVHDQHATAWKYHTRGYRFSHIDLGCAVQNLYLVAAGLGMVSCAVAGFFDAEASELLGLDRYERYVSLLFAAGPPPRPFDSGGG